MATVLTPNVDYARMTYSQLGDNCETAAFLQIGQDADFSKWDSL
jgi:hypothetical protein